MMPSATTPSLKLRVYIVPPIIFIATSNAEFLHLFVVLDAGWWDKEIYFRLLGLFAITFLCKLVRVLN